jgi:hypothetical protein
VALAVVIVDAIVGVETFQRRMRQRRDDVGNLPVHGIIKGAAIDPGATTINRAKLKSSWQFLAARGLELAVLVAYSREYYTGMAFWAWKSGTDLPL